MTPPTPARDTRAGRAYNDLRNLARRQRRDPAEYITLYALEGFLKRLVASEYATDFVLKGGVLMAAYAERRPTRDIDLSAGGFLNDLGGVERRIQSIAVVEVDDGLEFDASSVISEPIRDEADYTGVRVRLTARLATARITLQVDVNFGDPIWPAPVDITLPLMLGGTIRVVGYPDHMVLAEKVVTALERGELNTRWRDFTDIVALARTRDIQGVDLRHAIDTVARYRQVEVEPLGPLVTEMPTLVQHKWATWRKKQRLEDSTPAEFGDLLEACLRFAEPVLRGEVMNELWDAQTGLWVDTKRS